MQKISPNGNDVNLLEEHNLKHTWVQQWKKLHIQKILIYVTCRLLYMGNNNIKSNIVYRNNEKGVKLENNEAFGKVTNSWKIKDILLND